MFSFTTWEILRKQFVLYFSPLRIWKSINLEICIVDLTLWWRNSWRYYSHTLCRWFSPLATFSLRLLRPCQLAKSKLHSLVWEKNSILAEMVGHSLVCCSILPRPTFNESQAWVSILNVVKPQYHAYGVGLDLDVNCWFLKETLSSKGQRSFLLNGFR